MDIIFLREVRVDTVIGVYEWGAPRPQTIELDLDIGIPSEQPCHSDDIMTPSTMAWWWSGCALVGGRAFC